MNFKYYDLLANLIVGVVAFYALWHFCFPEWEISEWMVLPAGYIIGFFLDALSSILEPFFYWTIGGKPSGKLLNAKDRKPWTGLKRIRFYYSDQVVNLLKKDIQDDDASPDKQFSYAMRMVNANKDSRVPDFKSHYTLSRVILTTIILAIIIAEIRYYNVWYSWLISLGLLFLAWNRFKERGYYYTREVLNEYLKTKDSSRYADSKDLKGV